MAFIYPAACGLSPLVATGVPSVFALSYVYCSVWSVAVSCNWCAICFRSVLRILRGVGFCYQYDVCFGSVAPAQHLFVCCSSSLCGLVNGSFSTKPHYFEVPVCYMRQCTPSTLLQKLCSNSICQSSVKLPHIKEYFRKYPH